MVTIAVGVQDRPSPAPKTPGPWSSDWVLVGDPTFAEAIAAVSNLLFSFSGTPGEAEHARIPDFVEDWTDPYFQDSSQLYLKCATLDNTPVQCSPAKPV